MLKAAIGLTTAIFVAGFSPAYAQDAARPDTAGPKLTQTNMNILTDARLGIVKAVLQLTPEQAKYWPAVEEAIHARADARFRRIASFAATAEKVSQQSEIDPIELLRGRADALAQRAAGLKKLVDAWQPLYQSLNPDQKERMRLLAGRVIHQLQHGVDTRRMEMYDEDDDEG
jgi:hypothetical protein